VFSILRYLGQRRRPAEVENPAPQRVEETRETQPEQPPPEPPGSEQKAHEIPEATPGRIRIRRAKHESAAFLTCVFDTFALVGPRWGGPGGGEPSLGERFQVIIYRLLLVCALIGLANSNPTLRSMFDTLV
jgi:hypothetical protein